VVTMFERGEDTGDTPGEFQLWVEREHLDQILPLPPGASAALFRRRSAGPESPKVGIRFTHRAPMDCGLPSAFLRTG
jgi:hypothetical protein